MSETAADLVQICRSLFERGLTPGTTGNVSTRNDDTVLMTPTGRCMGRLAPQDLATVTLDGVTLGGVISPGPTPSKELGLHLAVYRRVPRATVVVHLHSPFATAVSCLADLDPEAALGTLTGYHALKVGRLALVPYHPPGSAELVTAVDAAFGNADAALLANHGLLVAGTSLESAADAAEQIEQSAQIYLLLGGRATSPVPGRSR